MSKCHIKRRGDPKGSFLAEKFTLNITSFSYSRFFRKIQFIAEPRVVGFFSCHHRLFLDETHLLRGNMIYFGSKLKKLANFWFWIPPSGVPTKNFVTIVFFSTRRVFEVVTWYTLDQNCRSYKNFQFLSPPRGSRPKFWCHRLRLSKRFPMMYDTCGYDQNCQN